MNLQIPFSSARSWQKMAADKREADMKKIPVDWLLSKSVVEEAKARQSIVGDFIEGLLDAETRKITALDISELIEAMESASLSAVQVVTAFSKRAAYVHQLSQNMLEIGFDSAIDRAKEIDDGFKASGELIGPLHGIPVTLKDQFHVRGLETTMGFVGWIDTFEGEKGTGKEKIVESPIITDLLRLGAIPLGKTTLVQSLWSPETNNNILGYQWNPHNQRLSSGGSSGGEGVMQAMKGSAFGLGTDIGGSVSLPASFNGVFSIKPSSGRISMKDVANTVMPGTVGIMGRSISSLRLVLKSLVSAEPWLEDPYVVPLRWRDDTGDLSEDDRPTFGFMPHDGNVTPHPPVSRAPEIVKKAMHEAGYSLLDWKPPSNNNSIAIHGPIARGDGCPDVWENLKLSGEPPVPEIASLFEGGGPKPPIPLPEYEKIVVHMKRYRYEYQDYWMQSAQRTGNGRPVQAVIMPVSPYAGVLPGKFFYSAYSSSINVLDYPSVVIPITVADQELDKVDPNFKPFSKTDKKNMDAYDPSAYHGGPASIQLVGTRWNEEGLLAAAQMVVDALKVHRSKL